MKLSVRSFKYGDAWLVSLSGRDWIEIPAIDGEAFADTHNRAMAALEGVSARLN